MDDSIKLIFTQNFEPTVDWYTKALHVRGRDYVENMLKYCEADEEYEECAVIKKVLDQADAEAKMVLKK